MMLTFHIPGPPVSWQRTASHRGHRITPRRQREYQLHVGACARTAAMLHRDWPLTTRYAVTIDLCAGDARRRDLDNAAKTVLDACNGVLWNDDSQIDDLHVRRMSEGAVGVRVSVEKIGP